MRAVVIAISAAILAVLVAVPVAADNPHVKKPICHRTASETTPWVIIMPDRASWYAHLDQHVNHNPKNGHGDKFATKWSDGGWRCRPEPRTGAIFVEGYVCGDPRVVMRSRSTWSVGQVLRVRYIHGRTGEVKNVLRFAPPGVKVYTPFWVEGKTVFKVWDKKSGELLWKTWTGRKKNIGRCP